MATNGCLPPQSSNKLGKVTDSCSALIGARQCSVMMAILYKTTKYVLMHPSLVQSFVVSTSNHSNVSSHNMTLCNLPLNLAPPVSLSTLLKPQVFALVVNTEAGSYANTRQTDSFSGCVCMWVLVCVCFCSTVGGWVFLCVCVRMVRVMLISYAVVCIVGVFVPIQG